jgi:hypothetical protein
MAADRPPVAAEVRAWIAVGVTLGVNLIGGAWWAATLSADMRNMREALAAVQQRVAEAYSTHDSARDLAIIRQQLADHESRVRELEKVRGR